MNFQKSLGVIIQSSHRGLCHRPLLNAWVELIIRPVGTKARVWRVIFCCVALCFQQCGQPKQFSEMPARDTGLHFRNEIAETEHNNIMTYEYTYNGGGVAVGDINNDGLTDIYFSGNSVPNKLYLNKGRLEGEWKFEDITEPSNTAGREDWKTGVTMADVNGDGWLDIYVCYSGNAPGEGFNKAVIMDHPKRANQLFINNGCEEGGIPTFSERAKDFGLDAIGTFSTQAYFLDYDRDGDLDMFLLNHANMFYSAYFNVKRLRSLRHPYFGNKLYRNDTPPTSPVSTAAVSTVALKEGNRKVFVEVSEQSGIHGSGLNFGLSAAISDLNADNWPDIYVTNDYEEQDFCYINNRDGSFTEVSHTIFGHLSKYGMGSDIADINNDGLQDIFVADMLPEGNHRQKLLKGPDEYDKYTLAVDSGYHHQYMRNTLQLNRGFAPDSLPRFSEMGQLAGISNTDWSWAPLFADFNNDGLKDIFITNGYLRDYTNMDFLKYIAHDAVEEANTNNHPVDMLALIHKMPSTKLNNYIFRNDDGIHFTNKTEEWGLSREVISNAAAYADLDNDGDYDLVVNNLNDEVSVFQNHHEKIQQNNYIKIKLAGNPPNTFGIGSKVWVTLDEQELYHEAHFTRGYQSSVEPLLTIGIGKATIIKKIKVLWPDDKVSIFADVAPNQILEVVQEKASDHTAANFTINKPLLKDVTAASGMDFRHVENSYVDFKSERLLLYQLSRLGGKLAVADVNGDGNDDVFFGGAAGQPGQLYFGQNDGTCIKAAPQPWEADKICEDLDAVFFDADTDGDLDLYVVSGGNEFPTEDPYHQDRLYLNDGKGGFTKASHALPAEAASGSCVAMADYDKDGDLDLFVGGRHVPHYYPLTPRSFLLRNDTPLSPPLRGDAEGRGVSFTEVTHEANENLQKAGMVTDAIWSDINGDAWPDLILVGEWMPVMVFQNENGKLRDITASCGLQESQGWWSKISACDVDGDGDTDFLLGNAGTNLQFHASAEEPVTCYTQDINQDGALDPVLCYYIQGKSYPLPSRDELLDQVTPLRKKFIKYADYADASIEDIFGEELMTSAHVLKAVTLQSSWVENLGSGQFRLKPLPAMAQTSMVNGFVHDDFDEDGQKEILAAGNFFPYRVQLGRSDASTGILLKFQQGDFQVYDITSPLWLTGDIRDMAVMQFKNAPKRIVISRNNAEAGIFEFTVNQ